MALSYPLTLPATRWPAEITIRARSVVGMSVSPFSQEQQVYVHQGECWMLSVVLQAMKRADAEKWVSMLLGLNGVEGTFLMGEPVNTSPQGTWLGSPKVLGAHAIGVKSIAMDGFTAGATVKAGDWIQQSSGANSHLYKIVQDATADGSGLLTLEIWPRLRLALVDNETFVTSSPKGIWRLASNEREWSIRHAQIYGIAFDAMEAL